MDLLQAWLLVGIPGLVVAGGLFTGRSMTRALLGYLALAALLAFFVTAVRDPVSAAVVGAIGVYLLATGRGSRAVESAPDHHRTRRRYTTARSPSALLDTHAGRQA